MLTNEGGKKNYANSSYLCLSCGKRVLERVKRKKMSQWAFFWDEYLMIYFRYSSAFVHYRFQYHASGNLNINDYEWAISGGHKKVVNWLKIYDNVRGGREKSFEAHFIKLNIKIKRKTETSKRNFWIAKLRCHQHLCKFL